MSSTTSRSPRIKICRAAVTVAISMLTLAVTAHSGWSEPTPPKVPFGNAPCKSLSLDEQKQVEQKSLGYARPVPGKPDRAPATLPFDNVCFYTGYVSVSYMTQVDFEANRDGNRNPKRTAPTNLPQAFYDKQGGLWFAKSGYYVVVSGKAKLVEPAASIIARKL